MKSCPSCNYKNNDADTICVACGTSLPEQSDNQYNGINLGKDENNNYQGDNYQNNDLNQTNTMPSINTLAIVSLATGIGSILMSCCCGCFGLIVVVPSIVTGILTLKNLNEFSHRNDKIFAIIGMSLAGVSLIIMILSIIFNLGGVLSEYY